VSTRVHAKTPARRGGEKEVGKKEIVGSIAELG